MPKDKGYEKGKLKSSTMVMNPKPAKKTSVKRKGVKK